jgi:hypothetical protein
MKQHHRGYTIFFATLVSSLALAIGLAIYDVTVRTLSLSGVTAQSQYAIYAADTGAECALYWDSKYTGSGTMFATSSASTAASGAAYCNGVDIRTVAAPTSFTVVSGAAYATTTFTMQLPSQVYNSSSVVPCANVEVGKVTSGGRVYTTVLSHGFNNNCGASGTNRVERILKVYY